MIDLILHLSKENIITKLEWLDSFWEQKLGPLWNTYIGKDLYTLEDFNQNSKKQLLFWKDETFHYYLHIQENENLLFLKREDYRQTYYEAAMDLVPESIQIYDRDGFAVFFNKSSDQLNTEPWGDVSHKHLVELFDLDENYSTTLTALRTKANVLNRFGRYKTYSGAKELTVTSAYPVEYEDQVVGAIAIEQNEPMLQRRQEQLNQILSSLEQNISHSTDSPQVSFQDLIGDSAAMKRVIQSAKELAATEHNLLLTGEAGTGKEMVARCIHQESSRKDLDFVSIDCVATSEALMDKLLFGPNGYFHQTYKGILFLKEITGLSLRIQSQILSALERSTKAIDNWEEAAYTKPRIFASTNADIKFLLQQQKLRRDFYYAIAIHTIQIPPLRERIDALETFIRYRMEQNRVFYVSSFREIDPEVLQILREYDWPGNIRELNHVIDFSMNVSTDTVLRIGYLPAFLFLRKERTDGYQMVGDKPYNGQTLQAAMDQFELEFLKSALAHFGGNISKTAEALDIKRQSLQYRLNKFDFKP